MLKELPPFEQELILAHILNKSREYVLTHSEIRLNRSQKSRFDNLINRRKNHEPLAYIFGHKEFYGLDFIVNKNVLVPRPETELLVETAIEKIRTGKNNASAILDIGTGSGCVIISIAKYFKKSENKFIASDISKKALRIARRNARMHRVDKKIIFFQSDLLNNKKMIEIINKQKLIILANLPYLDIAWKNLLKSTDSAGLKYEPKLALEGGTDGLDVYRRLAAQIIYLRNKKTILKTTLICEIGNTHRNKMSKLFSFSDKIAFKKDLAGKTRLAIITL